MNTGEGGKEVVEKLFSGHTEFISARRNFHPSVFIAVVAFGEIFGAKEDEVGVVGEVHWTVILFMALNFAHDANSNNKKLLR
jgi:hypothetical protein